MIRWTFHYIKHQPDDKDSASIDVSEQENESIYNAITFALNNGGALCELHNYNLPFVNVGELKAITRYVLPEEGTEPQTSSEVSHESV